MFDRSSSTNALLTASAVIELGAGLALLSCPSAAASILAGEPLEGPVSLTVARVAGAALIALGIACWLARDEARSRAARGLVASMIFYNIATVVILTRLGIGFGLYGVALWPGVVLHSVMTVWCAVFLCRRPQNVTVDSPVQQH